MPRDHQDSPAETGAVLRALLVTDLVSSTRLLEQLGDRRAFEVFGHHDRLARDLLHRHNGREIDKTDGFLLLFDRPIDAVGYAIDYHRALDELSAEVGVELQARAGIHLGEVYVRENPPEDVARGAKPLEVEGLAKPMAARLMSVAQGRQTLLTRGAFDLARRAAADRKDEALSWIEHGSYGFKGVDEPIRVFEVGEGGRAPLSPPPDSAKVWRVTDRGRPAEARARTRRRLLVAGAAAVLVTVAAVLAVVLGRGPAVSDDRRTVAVLGFSNLSRLEDAAWLSTALLETLTAELGSGGTLRTVPGEQVSRARKELGLDSYETLAEDTRDLLHRRLGADLLISGSYLRRPGSSLVDLTAWAQEVERDDPVARHMAKGSEDSLFDLVADTAAALRGQLGMAEAPTGAAALHASFPTTASGTRRYAEGLEALRASDPQRAVELLQQAVAADPDAPLVHEALAAAWIALGYTGRAREAATRARELAVATDSLPREQRLLIDARYAQTMGRWGDAVSAYATLVEFDPGNLEYGLKLAAAQVSVRQAEQAQATLATLRELPPPRGEDPRIDYQAARAARRVSDHPATRDAARRALSGARALQATQLEARCQVLLGLALENLGAGDEALAAYRAAEALSRELGDRSGLSRALNQLALVRWREGDLNAAGDLFEEVLDLARSIGDRRAEGRAYGNLANIALQRGDLDRAVTSYAAAADRFAEVGNQAMASVIQGNMARVRADQGRIVEARQLFEQALEDSAQPSNTAHLLSGLGDVLLLAGETGDALQRHRQALDLRLELGEPEEVAESRLSTAEVLLEMSRTGEAVDTVRSALEAFGDKRPDSRARAHAVLAEGLLASADLEGAQEQVEAAARLADAGDNLRIQQRVRLTSARVSVATGDLAVTRATLDKVCPPETQSERPSDCLEARLVRAKILRRDGRSAEAASQLATLEEEARGLGYGLIARKAAAARSRP